MTTQTKVLTIGGVLIAVYWLSSRTAIAATRQTAYIPSATRPPNGYGTAASPTGFGALVSSLGNLLGKVLPTATKPNPLTTDQPKSSGGGGGGSTGGGNAGPAFQNQSGNPNVWDPNGFFKGTSQTPTTSTPSTYADANGNVAYWDPNKGSYVDENGQPVTIDQGGNVTLDPLASTDLSLLAVDPTSSDPKQLAYVTPADQGAGDLAGLIADALANPPSTPDAQPTDSNDPGTPNQGGSVLSFSDAGSDGSGDSPLWSIPADAQPVADVGFGGGGLDSSDYFDYATME